MTDWRTARYIEHMSLAQMLLSTVVLTLTGPAAKDSLPDGANFRVITSTTGINTIGYPTCRTWSKDGRSLFVESSRPRPGGENRPGERQLLRIDVDTGKTVHLAALEAEDVAIYGKAHRVISSQYHADYAPDADVLVYYDMTGHTMYLLDVNTGRHQLILHEPEGTIGDPPSISVDGTRVVYYVIYPAVENSRFTDLVSVIYSLDVDPKTLRAAGKPRVVVAYPGQKGPKYAENKRDQVFIDHCQVNPVDKEHIAYAHEFSGCEVDGSLLKTRLWQVQADGTNNRPIVIQQPGEGHTHEVFGPKGKLIYWVSRGLVYCADFSSGKKKLVFDASKYGGCHVTVSPDERHLALDLWLGEGNDKHGNPVSGIMLVDTRTGDHRILCKFARRNGHPGHPHPNFSPDGSKIAFTLADGPNTQVAVVDVPRRK